MTINENISKNDLKDILSKNWLTHDAMWFAISVETLGMKQTNFINRKAARNMAKIEARRLSKLFNVKTIVKAQDLISFFDNTFSLIGGDYIICQYELISDSTIRFKTKKCFAFEGVSKLGVISEYECGIFERLEGWFEFFNLSYTKIPDDISCLMYKNGSCVKEYTFSF
jgi:hypothetical protein